MRKVGCLAGCVTPYLRCSVFVGCAFSVAIPTRVLWSPDAVTNSTSIIRQELNSVPCDVAARVDVPLPPPPPMLASTSSIKGAGESEMNVRVGYPSFYNGRYNKCYNVRYKIPSFYNVC